MLAYIYIFPFYGYYFIFVNFILRFIIPRKQWKINIYFLYHTKEWDILFGLQFNWYVAIIAI